MVDRGSGPNLRYVPGLDGARALAVVAVIAFHVFGWLPGGYFGVDIFFVLSGFLITSLLVTEWHGSGTVRLGSFWARRARRLLPALFVMVAVVGLVAAGWPSVFGRVDLFPNAVATVFYSANWFFVAHHATYLSAVGSDGSSPLLHTWSLAIEEQFYLVWPLVVLTVLRVGRRRRGRVLTGMGASSEEEVSPAGGTQAMRVAGKTQGELVFEGPAEVAADAGARSAELESARRLERLFALAVVGAAASALLMAFLAPTGSPTTRAYYGTDTRAQGLLVGAALATAFARWGAVRRPGARRALGACAVVGAVGIAAMMALVPLTSPLAFHGGFLLVSLAAAAVIAGAVQVPTGPVPAVLSLPPLRALGRVSYGVYLWYLPVLLVVSAGRTGLSGAPLFALQMAVIVGVATASYHLVELPIRRGWRPTWRLAVAAPVGAGLAIGAVALGMLAPLTPNVDGLSGLSSVSSASPGVQAAPGGSGTGGTSAAVGASNLAAIGAVAHPVKVLLVGDSIGGTLGVGLDQVAAGYGIELVNEGSPGCSLSMDQSFKVLAYTVPPGQPCEDGDPSALLDQWRRWVDAYNPDVVIYVARGELFDQEVDGQWESLGQPAFDDYATSRFEQGIEVLGEKGATVMLLTSPAYDSGTAPDGGAWPEDSPTRVAADDAVIRRAAAAVVAREDGGGQVSDPPVRVDTFGALVSPGGRFTPDVDGVDLRCADGVHFTEAGGEWVARRLLPLVAEAGRAHHDASASGAWPGPAPPAFPSWWTQLPCG